MDISSGISRNAGPGLYEFLMEAELQQYYAGIRGDLKVQTTAQLKYVTEEDLNAIGMSKPEMRRLKKYFQKYFPQNYLSKFKKMLLSKREEQPSGALAILPEEKQDKPAIKVPNKHMIPADAIIVNKELGMGEFGVVQQGVWTNDGERIQVAIKCLSRERMQNNPIEFLKEAAIMHAIDHEHIVRLYGVVLDTNSLMLVTELAPLRSLLECLKEPSLRGSFPVLSLFDFSIQISDGMQYLEAKRLIHRDLAARNILVFSKNKVKISDFGLSRALGVGKDYYQTNFNVNLKLPIAWCAPECISYLKFTSASDVWAYGVTLWEMFSYGFQPWAALTGHQILEAIDEPNYQRLEQPDCCPKDYFSLMLQCWQHEPAKRPKFSELINLLPDLKPEQVQAVQDSGEIGQLCYRQGDIITVLDKGSNNILWKGVLPSGKTGLFNPAHTIAYLGSNLPSNKPGEFSRGDGKNAFSSQRRKIRTDMISSPQGDLKHTGHVGLDGAYFGDISFLGGKYPHLPRQVVTPYKPHEDVPDNSSQVYNQDGRECREVRDGRECRSEAGRNRGQEVKHENVWEGNDVVMGNGGKAKSGGKRVLEGLPADHEYHEISDEENQDSPLRFDKPLNFDFGPSLLDEMDQMFRSLGTSPPPPPPGHPGSTDHEASNARNELREIQAKQSSKKKQATVKPISAADQKTLYSAIAMAQELTARSMSDLEHPPESPRTPVSPSRRRKFSFKLPHQHSPKPDRRHFSEEAASIPDIQWLCTSLQSLSSTVSSIESLGAPSTLKLPLWDKASAEFCFAKSRELLTKPSAWTSYMDVDFESHFLDNEAIKQHLVKSSEFLENGNRQDLTPRLAKNPLDQRNHAPNVNGKSYCSNPNLEIPRDVKRVSASYVDRYFDQSNVSTYYEDETSFNCMDRSLDTFGNEPQRIENVNNMDETNRSEYWKNYDEISMRREHIIQEKVMNNQDFSDLPPRSTDSTESPRSKAKSFDLTTESFSNFDLGTRPKAPGSVKLNISRDDVEKRLEFQKTRTPRPNLESVRVKIQSYRKSEENKNGHDNFPFLISNNPLFISEPDKKESPVYSSSESLRMNFQRLRRKSDVDVNNQEDLSSKIFAEKYQREVSGLESVKNYLDAKKGQRFNLGLGKLTQNMIQLGKNIAQNSRNLDLPRMSSLRTDNQGLRIEGNSSETGNPSLSNDTKSTVSMKLQKNLVLDLGHSNLRSSVPGGGNSSPLRSHILEPAKIYQNDVIKKEQLKPEIIVDKVQGTPNVYRHRTSSLSEVRKTTIKGIRRSYHPDNESSEDSDSISHSETDIRSRLKFKRRYRKIPQGFKLNFKNKGTLLNPESARRGGMGLEVTGKSPPPSTSFLNSLSPPFASRNNLVSWPESAPSSSLTFTSNSELDSDTSSEYPEFTQDTLTFPPSPAP